MADLGISIAGRLIEVIGCEIVKEVCDMWGYKSQLADLKQTVSTIKKVLLDAQAKRELSHEEQDYIQKLNDAVYDADDLFDELLVLAELKQLGRLSKRGKLYEKVCSFFASKNQVGPAYKMSREVKEIKKRLDVVADNHKKFRFKYDYQPISRRREESCSSIDANEIIGRETDKEAIIDTLLDSNVNEDFCFVTIVGVGGLGKTALGQLVYNDEKIKKEFSALRLWVCVSDQDGERFDVKAILCKILELLVFPKELESTSTMEFVQNELQKHLRGKKYLLVLDDVWNEDRQKWLDLKKFIMLGQGGSRIVVTTRSEMTATIIGDKHAYKLEGLSQENSRHLFNMSAFAQGHELENHKLVEIARKIVEKCYRNPLAIKVVGRLLYGQDITKWEAFETIGLAELDKGDNGIISILKLSYHNLEPSFKSCFSYCGVFPKDFEFGKEMLIGLWMAQGYIVPLDGSQSIEDAAEEHFQILLRRCFFQDVKKDEYGDIESFKIHDLMHDVAQEVGRNEIHVVTSFPNNLANKIRHVKYVDDQSPESSSHTAKIRSYICSVRDVYSLHINVDKWMCLRVLDLPYGYGDLPDSIGNLLHLRYLNLATNECLVLLPDSITKLLNMQTLILRGCCNLRELPKDFSKLVKLKHLDLMDCGRFICMPSGIDNLTSLTMLSFFVVGKKISTEKQSDEAFKELKVLTRIKGNMCLKIGRNYRHMEGMNDSGGEYLKSMKHLRKVSIEYESDDDKCGYHGAALENLEPHPNLKVFTMYNYSGTTIPRWGRAEDNWAISHPHLVHIRLWFCTNLEQIPVLSKLPYLKSLELDWLDLEYMENTSIVTRASELEVFFPSLESLELKHMEKLKGWWMEEQLVDDDHLLRRLRFPRLSKLIIGMCRNLTSFPRCPNLEYLHLFGTNETLQQIIEEETDGSSEDDSDDNIEDDSDDNSEDDTDDNSEDGTDGNSDINANDNSEYGADVNPEDDTDEIQKVDIN